MNEEGNGKSEKERNRKTEKTREKIREKTRERKARRGYVCARQKET